MVSLLTRYLAKISLAWRVRIELMKMPANDLRILALWMAVVPLVTFNVSYLIAVAYEHVPACIPYLSGCTSVSSTGRMAPESLVFKAGMLSTVVVVALLWHRSATLLRSNVLRVFGFLAATSLMLYAVILGGKGDELRLLRRIGIDGFALSNLLIQISFIILYRPLRITATQKLFRWLVVLCIALPLLGVAAEVAKAVGMPRRATNNAVAWNAFVVVSAYYAVVARIWWHHGMSGGRPISPSE